MIYLMKELTRVYSVFEADIICSKLRAAGIHAFPQSKETFNIVPNVHDGIRILIAEEDYDEARRILSA